jgi:hypothetical protein
VNADRLRNIVAICCGQRLRWKSIDRTHLVMTYCSRCQETRWYSDGLPVNQSEVSSNIGTQAWATDRRRELRDEQRPHQA